MKDISLHKSLSKPPRDYSERAFSFNTSLKFSVEVFSDWCSQRNFLFCHFPLDLIISLFSTDFFATFLSSLTLFVFFPSSLSNYSGKPAFSQTFFFPPAASEALKLRKYRRNNSSAEENIIFFSLSIPRSTPSFPSHSMAYRSR